MSAQNMKREMKAQKIHTKKSLGQNFLSDERILSKILEAADIKSQDVVLEIGPGMGTLTEKLCQKAAKVVAVEIDKTLVSYLKGHLSHENLTVIEADFLALSLDSFLDQHVGPSKIKVVANIPYYITAPIVMKLLAYKDKFECIVLMVQEEVADRLTARPGTKAYGSMTLAVCYEAEAQKCFQVTKDYFTPPPKVDSAVVRLTPWQQYEDMAIDKALLFDCIRAAFATRRKTLLNGLVKNGGYHKERVLSALKAMELDEKVRGEALSLSQFIDFCTYYEKGTFYAKGQERE